MKTITFTPEDLDLFSSASHDRNPLHLSDEYARRTPYGGRVVFGVLDGLTALGFLADRRESVLSSIEFEFFDTALLGIEYSVHTVETQSEGTVRIMDGRRPVLEAVLTYRPGRSQSSRLNEWQSAAPEPRNLSGAQLAVGQRVHGKYGPSLKHLEMLCSRIKLTQSWATPLRTAATMWASYLVGMELPGKRALFSRMSIEFQDSEQATAPFDYRAEIVEVSDVGELTVHANLMSEGTSWAKAIIGAHVREDLPPVTTESIEKLVGRSQALAGKVAFVTGGSRGLGADLVRVLALHGCTVIVNFARSQHQAEQLRESLSQTPGKIILEQGDAAGLAWCNETKERVAAQFGRLDFLICNASPSLLPLWLETSAGERVHNFIEKSLALVSAPTMAFLSLPASGKGWNVLI